MTNLEKLSALAKAALEYGDDPTEKGWHSRHYLNRFLATEDTEFVAAVNPTVILELINRIESLESRMKEAQKIIGDLIGDLIGVSDDYQMNQEARAYLTRHRGMRINENKKL